MSVRAAAALLFFTLVGAILMGNLSPSGDLAAAQSLRCDMFQIFDSSHGEYGWPPASNPSAADRCKADH